MKRYWQNDRGYSLLLAIFAILIFSILGLSLITLTSSGVAKNTNREEIIQATDLSEKGIDYMIKNIQAELENHITSGNIGRDQFLTKLINTIESADLSCENEGIKIPGDLGKTSVCIDVDNIENVYIEKEDGTKILQQLKKKVPIISTGYVNGKEKVTTTEVIVGTDAIPDQLRYALSTNNGGNLYLHGGIEVHGDIKTDNNLIVSKQATWFRGTNSIWQPSVRTKLIAGPGSVTPKIIFGKENKAVYDLKKFTEYNKHINGSNLNNSSYYTKYDAATTEGKESISNLFFNSPEISVLTKDLLPQDTVEVTNKILANYNSVSNKKNYTDNLTISSTNHETKTLNKTDVVFVSDTGTERIQETYTYYETVCIKEERVRKRDKRGGYYWVWECVEWDQQEKTGTRWTDKDTFKFGKMTINGGNDKKDITLKGTYYVYGDLTIKDVNLKADAIIYVQGTVDISESTIQGISENENSTLIIFSNGHIDIYNMSVDSGKDDASKIKGFFYTKQDMIMYGVGSNINLTGGISARRLILTAVRGDTENGYLDEEEQSKIENSVPKHYSRLKIVYDQDLIATYTEFSRDEEEEYIKSINEPEIINRY